MRVRFTFGLLLVVVLSSCGEENDPLATDIVLSGKVTNNSGQSGTVIVEIDHNKRDIADAEGFYAIPLRANFLVDSLYAFADKNKNGVYTSGELFGFYKSSQNSTRAQKIHVRTSDVRNVNFSIP
jgi:hypothetical protein